MNKVSLNFAEILVKSDRTTLIEIFLTMCKYFGYLWYILSLVANYLKFENLKIVNILKNAIVLH